MLRSTNLIFFSLWLVAASAASYTPCEKFCITRASPSDLANISLRLYPNKTMDEYRSVLIGNALDLLDNINPTKRTVMYIPGWTESPNSTSVISVLSAYLKRQDHNILLLNYEEIAANTYPYVVLSANGLGYTLAGALNELVAAGLNSSNIHIVSHSLGCQVAGFTGRYVNYTQPRITALDPAGPGIDYTIDNLSPSDAEFVDIIHTDAGFYGSTTSSGSANFYPNGGTRLQPGCKDFRLPGSLEDFCDHRRSWYFYTESLLNEDAFIGLECDSYHSFQGGFCKSNSRAVMGYKTPTTASGSFYLQTRSTSPFGKGEDGVDHTASALSITSILSIFNPFSPHR